MVNLEVDGQPITIENGKTVMDAANQLGIYVPHFCYHKKLAIAANCRMCLVQVEKAPKPLPACATPVTEGMKVFTHSDGAIKAQKGVMEFLLINHPLDCPICDQGGECQLQDLAVGYGASGSRYEEDKRVVVNKNLGPLIATDMTRCIHCTRCVRFGQEIAGMMELGMIGRGEHAEIIQFVGTTVNSELSGNMIDVCPVGALTSKPFRYSARTWELTRKASISPHCGLGSNLTVQTKNNKVMRVLPRDSEVINECWLSDKDRFSYEGLNSPARLTRPMVKENGAWRECDWQHALNAVAAGLKNTIVRHGANQLGALATPHQTLEELYLLQKLVRGLGSNNIDFRLRQADFSADGKLVGAPWLGFPIADFNTLERALIIGSNLRKDHPLIAQRLRQAIKRGAQISIVHPVDHDLALRVHAKAIVAPSAMPIVLAQILKAIAQEKGVSVAPEYANTVASLSPSEACVLIGKSILSRVNRAVVLGNLAQQHPNAAQIHQLAQAIAQLAEAKFGVLGEAANSVGGAIAQALPFDSTGVKGLNAAAMLREPRKAYLLLGAEPELDCHDAAAAMRAMRAAEFVVALSPYRHAAADYAHVMLPIAPFSETPGTFVSTEGRAQSFTAVVTPFGDTRPAWKVLRVLGTLMGLMGFEHDSVEGVRHELNPNLQDWVTRSLSNEIHVASMAPLSIGASDRFTGLQAVLERVGEVPIYGADAIVRRAASLQKTKDAAPPFAAMSGKLLERLNLQAGAKVRVKQDGGEALLDAARDDAVADGCVRIDGAHSLTAGLGALFGAVEIEAR